MAWYDFLGKDAGSIARQRLSARAAIPAARAAGGVGSAIRTGMGLTPQGLLLNAGVFAAPYVAEAAANYLRSPQGVLLKDRLGQGDIPGAFTALTGFGRQSSPLRQYNPPGFDPNKPVTSGDLLRSATEVSPLFTRNIAESPAAERAYRQEVSSIAQQAAQNPELQRYEKERAAAAASKDQGKMDAVRDLGMQIWAQKYGKPGDLASRVKPGQSGYDVIQRTLGAGQMGSPMNFGFDSSSPLATTPPVVAPSYAGATPASLPGATPLPSNAFSGMVTTPYDRFNAGQTLTSAPLGMPGAQIPGTYEGATGVQGMGASLGATPSMFNPSDEKAKALLEAFKNRQFSVQK